MSLLGKIFAVISLLAAVFYTGITVTLVSLQENYKQKLVDADQKFKTAQTNWEQEKEGLDQSIARLTLERNSLNSAKADLEAKNAILESEWAQATNNVRFAMKIVEDQEEQITRLNDLLELARKNLNERTTDIETLRAEIEQQKNALAALEQKRDELQDKLVVKEKELKMIADEAKRLTDEYAYANDLIRKLEKAVPDEVAKARSADTIQAPKTIRGKVAAVDAKLGLVVINVGQRQGVQKDYAFIVFRGSQYVGKIIVDEVFPDVAACRYSRPDMKDDVQVGDDVTTKLVVQF
jgi:Na+-transporting NADH:ubiquinone oxidoreductase subunit NqrC